MCEFRFPIYDHGKCDHRLAHSSNKRRRDVEFEKTTLANPRPVPPPSRQYSMYHQPHQKQTLVTPLPALSNHKKNWCCVAAGCVLNDTVLVVAAVRALGGETAVGKGGKCEGERQTPNRRRGRNFVGVTKCHDLSMPRYQDSGSSEGLPKGGSGVPLEACRSTHRGMYVCMYVCMCMLLRAPSLT